MTAFVPWRLWLHDAYCDYCQQRFVGALKTPVTLNKGWKKRERKSLTLDLEFIVYLMGLLLAEPQTLCPLFHLPPPIIGSCQSELFQTWPDDNHLWILPVSISVLLSLTLSAKIKVTLKRLHQKLKVRCHGVLIYVQTLCGCCNLYTCVFFKIFYRSVKHHIWRNLLMFKVLLFFVASVWICCKTVCFKCASSCDRNLIPIIVRVTCLHFYFFSHLPFWDSHEKNECVHFW